MQIFVKHPSTNQTLIYECTANTRLEEFIEWIYDRIGWPLKTYYLVHRTKIIDTKTSGQASKTFKELGIENEDSVNVVGRLIG